MRKCEDVKLWRREDGKMTRCEDGKMWRWEDVMTDLHSSSVALFLPLWSFDTEIDSSIYFFPFGNANFGFEQFSWVGLIFFQLNKFEWKYSFFSLWFERKFAQKTRKFPQTANSKTVANPAGNDTLRTFTLQTNTFFVNERKSPRAEKKRYTNKCIIGGSSLGHVLKPKWLTWFGPLTVKRGTRSFFMLYFFGISTDLWQ